MKKCSKCDEIKPLTGFYVKDSKSGRMHAQCKNCFKEHRKTYHSDHYEKYGELYRERARNYRNKVKQQHREKMRAYMSNKSCEKCGEADLVVLELDHIDPKTKLFSISQAIRLGRTWDEVLSELEKCRVLCANCHKRITAQQFGWYKAM